MNPAMIAAQQMELRIKNKAPDKLDNAKSGGLLKRVDPMPNKSSKEASMDSMMDIVLKLRSMKEDIKNNGRDSTGSA
tara:strand:+ start:304 stop:534 length:231 start_codon:yes stop_codon:yes gene_type:complete